MTDKADLHTHSTCSDGTFSPRDLARAAKETGLRAVALTDHDTMRGVNEFLDECRLLGIEGIAGAELGTDYPKTLHIVALCAHGVEFAAMLERFGKSRGERNRKILGMLQADGFDITEEDITNHEKGITVDSSGRLYIAKALVAKGYCTDVNDAFARFIDSGRPYYAKRFTLTPEESVRLIKRSGGIAIWAHPAEAADTEDEMLEIASMLKAAGLDGMECLYSRYTDEDTEMCTRVANKVGLLRSGGSDFHGANKPDVQLGAVHGGYVPYNIWEDLKKHRDGK